MINSVVRIYESELDLLVQETDRHPNIETGGSLYGLWTDAGNPTIFLAIGPGPGSKHLTYEFQQDAATHHAIEQAVVDTFGVQAIGLWHSHHRIGLRELSGGDLSRTKQFARRTGRSRFCDVLSYFDDRSARDVVSVKPYVYLDAGTGSRVATSMTVLSGISPIRSALQTGSIPYRDLAAHQSALGQPHGGAGRWRLEESAASGDDYELTLMQRVKARFRGRTELEQTDSASEPQLVAAGPEQTGIEPERSDLPEPNEPDRPTREPESTVETEPPFVITNLARFVEDHVQPALRRVPPSVRCELEPAHNGELLLLTMTPRSQAQQHSLYLGWDGRHPVVVGHQWRERGRPQALVLFADAGPAVLADRIHDVLEQLAESERRR